jgi:integrase
MFTEPIRDKKHIRQLVDYYITKKKNQRNHLLIIMGLYTALRIGDLLSLSWGSVYDFDKGEFKRHIKLREKKTGKSKTIAINKQAAHALRKYLIALGGIKSVSDSEPLFKNNRRTNSSISRVQAWRIIKTAGDAINERVSCHSLRKTFGYHAWRAGVPSPVIMDIFNHSSYAVTRRYLGITQDDRDTVYLKTAGRVATTPMRHFLVDSTPICVGFS